MPMLKTKWIALLAIPLLLLGRPQTANATILNPGDPATPLDPTALDAGATVLDSISGTLVAPTFTADYTAAVIQESALDNPLGGLTFIYQVTSLTGDAIVRITASSFTGFTTDVYFATNGSVIAGFDDGLIAPDSGDRAGTGSGVGFNFDIPGLSSESLVLVIRTDAPSYVLGLIAAQDDTNDFDTAFQPSVAPEPATLLLFGSGLAGLGAAIRRRRAQQQN